MKEHYFPPKVEIVIFGPIEEISFDLLPPFQFDLRYLTDLDRSAGPPTLSQEGDIFLPFW